MNRTYLLEFFPNSALAKILKWSLIGNLCVLKSYWVLFALLSPQAPISISPTWRTCTQLDTQCLSSPWPSLSPYSVCSGEKYVCYPCAPPWTADKPHLSPFVGTSLKAEPGSIFPQETALHQELHPHPAVYLLHSESYVHLHQRLSAIYGRKPLPLRLLPGMDGLSFRSCTFAL